MTEISAEKPLLNQNILLAVTGSVAACKSDRVLRLCQESGANVRVLLTESGARFFPPDLAGALSDNEVYRQTFCQSSPGRMPHIELKRWADAILVAPATANRLLNLLKPEANDLLSTVLHAFRGPVLYAPAMNPDMWDQPEIHRVLEQYSQQIILPSDGEMACGDVGPGRFPPPQRILDRLIEQIWPSPLANQSWIISAGPTREPWDEVRVLTNRSSGKMGRELATVGYWLGAEIDLVTGACHPDPKNTIYPVIQVETARDMLEQLMEGMEGTTGYIGTAAVSDYRPGRATGKIRSGLDDLSLPLESNPDILTELRNQFPESTLIGFSVDDRNDPETALEKMENKGLDGIVFNSLQQKDGGFSSDYNSAQFCFSDGSILNLGRRSKRSLAQQIWIGIIKEAVT